MWQLVESKYCDFLLIYMMMSAFIRTSMHLSRLQLKKKCGQNYSTWISHFLCRR